MNRFMEIGEKMDDQPEESKLYVKFSRNITFCESFLKKHNIEYFEQI